MLKISTIVKRKDGYYVVSESKDKEGKHKNLGGPYSSREKAVARLKQVEYFKHKGSPNKLASKDETLELAGHKLHLDILNERDRFSLLLNDDSTDEELFCAFDEDAVSLFEDGFLDYRKGPIIKQLISYLRDINPGVIKKIEDNPIPPKEENLENSKKGSLMKHFHNKNKLAKLIKLAKEEIDVIENEMVDADNDSAFDELMRKREELENEIKEMKEGILLLNAWETFKSGEWSEAIKVKLDSLDSQIGAVIDEEAPSPMENNLGGEVDMTSQNGEEQVDIDLPKQDGGVDVTVSPEAEGSAPPPPTKTSSLLNKKAAGEPGDYLLSDINEVKKLTSPYVLIFTTMGGDYASLPEFEIQTGQEFVAFEYKPIPGPIRTIDELIKAVGGKRSYALRPWMSEDEEGGDDWFTCSINKDILVNWLEEKYAEETKGIVKSQEEIFDELRQISPPITGDYTPDDDEDFDDEDFDDEDFDDEDFDDEDFDDEDEDGSSKKGSLVSKKTNFKNQNMKNSSSKDDEMRKSKLFSLRNKQASVSKEAAALRTEVKVRVASAWTIAKTMLPTAPVPVQTSFAETLLKNTTPVIKAALQQTAKNAAFYKICENIARVHKLEMNDLLEKASALEEAKSAILKEMKGKAVNANAKKADDRKDAGPQPEKYDEGKREEPKLNDGKASAIDGEHASDRPENSIDKSEGSDKIIKNSKNKKKAHGDDCKGCPQCKTADDESGDIPSDDENENNPEDAKTKLVQDDEQTDLDTKITELEDANRTLADAIAEEMGSDVEEDILDQMEDNSEEGELDDLDVEFNEDELSDGDVELDETVEDENTGDELQLDEVFNSENLETKRSSLANEDKTAAEIDDIEVEFEPSEAEAMEEALDGGPEEVFDINFNDNFNLNASDTTGIDSFLSGKVAVKGIEVLNYGDVYKEFERSGEDGRDSQSDHEGTILEQLLNDILPEPIKGMNDRDGKTELQEPKKVAKKTATIRKINPVQGSTTTDLADLLFGNNKF